MHSFNYFKRITCFNLYYSPISWHYHYVPFKDDKWQREASNSLNLLGIQKQPKGSTLKCLLQLSSPATLRHRSN